MSEFKLSRAWQDVPDGAILPHDTPYHTRMNPNTGLRQARLKLCAHCGEPVREADRWKEGPVGEDWHKGCAGAHAGRDARSEPVDRVEPATPGPQARESAPAPGHERDAAIQALAKAYLERALPAQPTINAATRRLDWTALAPRFPPEREWTWPDQIPARTVTLLHGPGGTGKTTIAQQLATAKALGLPMLGGTPLKAGKVLAWFGEDDHDELWRRQVAINRALGMSEDPAAALAQTLARRGRPNGPEPPDPNALLPLEGKGVFHALPGDDITLFLAKNEGAYQEGPAMPVLREQLGDIKPQLTILDSAAKIYGGPENNRQLVTRCVQVLIGLCRDFDTSIVIIGHDNKSGDTYSGSTAWENTVRARLHFKREHEVDDDGKPVKGGDSHNVLVRPKANYSATDDVGIAMKWQGGAFISLDPAHVTPEMAALKTLAEIEADQHFLGALRELTARQISTSDAPTSPYYAPRQVIKHGLHGALTLRQLEKVVRRLRMSGALAMGDLPWKLKKRTPAHGLIICT